MLDCSQLSRKEQKVFYKKSKFPREEEHFRNAYSSRDTYAVRFSVTAKVLKKFLHVVRRSYDFENLEAQYDSNTEEHFQIFF
jgi:phosphopantetheinyl transferase (holo-ACP synthase)